MKNSSEGQSGEWFPHVKKITRVLVQHFGHSSLGNKKNPFNEFLYIILSSKTPPYRYQKAYKKLKLSYPRFDDLAEATIDDLATVIEFAGLEKKKATQIIQSAIRLKQLFGRVTLSPLRAMSNEEAEKLLTSLPGIQIKSARCILLYSLNRLVFPADNHCLRIAQRLGWIDKATFSKGTANFLQNRIPPRLHRDLHVGMVLLGRTYCLPKVPQCNDCPIRQFCPTGLSNIESLR
jgi:endonuclease III